MKQAIRLALSYLILFQLMARTPVAFADDVTTWSRLSFDTHLASIEDFFEQHKGRSKKKLIEIILEENVRTHFFRLQALAKMHRPLDESTFNGIRKVSKKIEDRIGAVDLYTDLVRVSRDVVKNHELTNYFMRQLEKAEDKLILELEDSQLLTDPAKYATKTRTSLDSIANWRGKEKSNRDYILAFVANFTRDLQEFIDKSKFDSDDIEKGLHELRRELRWALIYMQALVKKVQSSYDDELSRVGVTWFEELAAENPAGLMSNKYIQFASVQSEDPISFPMNNGAIITQVVAEIGDSKDVAEHQIYIGEALKELSYSDDYILRVVSLLNNDRAELDHQKLSNDYQKRIRSARLMMNCSVYFEGQKSW